MEELLLDALDNPQKIRPLNVAFFYEENLGQDNTFGKCHNKTRS